MASRILLGAGGAVGEGFFREAAKALAETFGVRWVLFGEYDKGGDTSARTIVFWDRDFADNDRFPLRGTLWGHLLETGDCIFPEKLRGTFSEDSALGRIGAEGCVGRQIKATDGSVIGFVTVLDEKPIAAPQVIDDALGVLAARAAAELERLIQRPLVERLGRIVEEGLSEAYVFSGETFRFEMVNRGARENLGFSMDELAEMSPWDLKPDFSEEQFREMVAPLLLGETEVARFETRHRRKDGSCYDVFVRLEYFAPPDNVFFASINDITQRREAERRERVLVNEVNHRSKNLLGLVQAIAQQTADGDRDSFHRRLGALAANQDVLLRNSWQRVPIEHLVRSQLGFVEHMLGSRIVLEGPDLAINARTSQVLGMALHELATNAIKYGALSGEAGRVDIEWAIEAGALRFEWRESDGPPVTPPEREGFGSALIHEQPRYALGAEVESRFDPGGLRYGLTIDMDEVRDRPDKGE